MSNLTDLLPAGAGGKQVSFVASGTIGNGVTVGLNSDGTVSVVEETAQSVGTPVVFENADSTNTSTVFDSNTNKVLIAYRDNGNSFYGTAVVGTVSGTSISFGTPKVFSSTNTSSVTATFDSTNNKVVVAYRDVTNFGYGTAKVFTISGTTYSFGAAAIYEAASVTYNAITFDPINGKVVIVYRDVGNADAGTAIVGTVSGTSISFGSPSTFTTDASDTAVAFDSNAGKVVIIFRNNANSNYGTGVVGTVSGTSISFGALTVFNSADSAYNSATFDSNANKIVAAYKDVGNSGYGTAVVGTVSGTSISFGTPVVFESVLINYTALTFDSANNKVVIAWNSNIPGGEVSTATVSGTSISFDSPVNFNTRSYWLSCAFDSNSNVTVIAYEDDENLDYGEAVVFKSASTNNTDFIGVSDAAISDTASGSVTIKGGISTNVTGLTPNSTYYVQADGSLSTTSSDVLAGKALSSTSINLDYTS